MHYTIKVFLCNQTCHTVLVFLMYLENLMEKQMELGKVDGAPDGIFLRMLAGKVSGAPDETFLEEWLGKQNI